MAGQATIYFRMRATKDVKGNWQADAAGGWRFIAVPAGQGRRPVWLKDAEKSAASGSRGFQFRLSNGNWSEPIYATVEAAQEAAESMPAQRVAIERGLTVAENTNPKNAARVPIKSAMEAYLARKRGKKSDKTVAKYEYVLNEFASQLPRHIKFVDQVDNNVFENFFQFLKQNGAAPKTIKDKILNVCFLLKFAGVKDPSKMIELPTVEDEPVEPYTTEDLKALFDAMDTEDIVRYRFFLDTACREAEVAHAQWDDIDWKKAEYIVRTKTWTAPNGTAKEFTTKNHKSRRVPLSQALVKLLRSRQKTSKSIWIFANGDGQPEGHFLRKFKKLAHTAGLNCGRCIGTRVVGQYENKKSVTSNCADNAEGCEKHYLHRLRKTRATFWHENGVSLRTIQHWLSHESLETTMKYLGIKDSAGLQKEINLAMY
jgi:integrase